MKNYLILNKWYLLRNSNLRLVSILGTDFTFDDFIHVEQPNQISVIDLRQLKELKFIIHKSVYPYSCRKVYKNLYSISNVDTGTTLLSNFEYEDLNDVIKDFFIHHSVKSVIKEINQQVKLTKYYLKV